MEHWATATNPNSKMEHGHEPWHLPISHKMHLQTRFSIRNFTYSQALDQAQRNGDTDGAYLNCKSLSKLIPEWQGSSASSVITPLHQPPVFVGAPRENSHAEFLRRLVVVASWKTMIAPIERVRLLMQSENALIQSGRLSQPYKGILNCFARTISNEGLISLWRGDTARIIARSSYMAKIFAITSYAKSRPNGHWDYGDILALFGFLGAYVVVGYPFHYAGTRLANDIKTTSNGKWQFNDIVDVFRKTLKSDGIAGLYRGFPILIIEDSLGVFLSKTLRSNALKQQQLLHLFGFKQDVFRGMSILSLVLEVCTRVVTYPIDTVNKRMMMTSGEAIKYKNTFHAFSQIFVNEGVKSFYRGGGAEILKVTVIWSQIVLFVYLKGAIMGKKNGPAGDGGQQPASSFTIRWMKNKEEKS